MEARCLVCRRTDTASLENVIQLVHLVKKTGDSEVSLLITTKAAICSYSLRTGSIQTGDATRGSEVNKIELGAASLRNLGLNPASCDTTETRHIKLTPPLIGKSYVLRTSLSCGRTRHCRSSKLGFLCWPTYVCLEGRAKRVTNRLGFDGGTYTREVL
jgi:hypothetical protein